MSSTPPCAQCGAPVPLRACVKDEAGLRRILIGNMVDLVRCEACGALWCLGMRGARAKSRTGVLWPHDPRDWQRVYDLDDGASLARWYLKQARQLSRLPVPAAEPAPASPD